jgi:hypothetical protein
LSAAAALSRITQADNALRARHYSARTEEAYVAWARRFILFHNKRHPSAMGPEEVNAYLTALATRDRVSAATQNQALCAILFCTGTSCRILSLGSTTWCGPAAGAAPGGADAG